MARAARPGRGASSSASVGGGVGAADSGAAAAVACWDAESVREAGLTELALGSLGLALAPDTLRTKHHQLARPRPEAVVERLEVLTIPQGVRRPVFKNLLLARA